MTQQANLVNAAQLLNQKQTAAALGLSAGRLSQLKKEGRITYADPVRKLYDVEQVRAQWERTADVRQSVATETRRQVRESGAVPSPVLLQAQAALREDDEEIVDVDLYDEDPEYGEDYHEAYKISSALKMREQHRNERLDRLEKEALVGSVAKMEREAYTTTRLVRDDLLGAFSAKLAPELAVMTNVFEIEQVLREALRVRLQALGHDGEVTHGAG